MLGKNRLAIRVNLDLAGAFHPGPFKAKVETTYSSEETQKPHFLFLLPRVKPAPCLARKLIAGN
jgi:hypothetical protein